MKSKNNDTRLEKGDKTSAKILMSAMEVISQNGIGGISATKLSKLSNVSKSAIFYHFKSIQEIPQAVLRLIFDSFLRPIEAKEHDNLADFLNRMGLSLIEQTDESLKMYKSFFSFYHESMFNEIYKELLSDFLKISKENLTANIKNLSGAQISDSEATQFATLILAMLDGIGMHILLGGDRDEYLSAWMQQVKLFCSMIANHT